MGATEASTDGRVQAVSPPGLLRDVWSLGKPRLSSLVIFTAGGGLFLAPGDPSFHTVLAAMLGTTMVVASANALNNTIERDSDKYMERTANRPLPAGRMKPWVALVYGLVLAAISFPWLYIATTPMAAGLALIAFVVYVAVYTPMKRRSWLSVLVGGVAGAMPPLIGWTAVSGTIDPGGIALFAVLFLWQIPHSLAIAMYRKEEYAKAGLKVLPNVVNDAHTRQQIMAYVVGLVAVTLWMVKLELGGALFLAGASGLGLVFLVKAWKGLRNQGGAVWARDLFFYSLIYLSGLFIVMVIDHVL
jgi:protoheme IX farnesyltransferase